MPSNKPQLKTYTTQDVIDKFEIIASEENRSMSKELEYIVKEYIKLYESKHGNINVKNIVSMRDNNGTINM